MNKKLSLTLAGLVLLPTSVAMASQMSNSIDSQINPPAKVSSESLVPTSILEFSSLNFPKSVGKNSPVHIKFSLKNTGDTPAKNISINAISQDLQGLVPKSVSKVNVRNLAPGQEESYQFEFEISDNAKAQNYPVKIIVNYADEKTNELHTTSQTMTVSVKDGSSGASNDKLPDQVGDLAGDLGGLPSISGGGGGSLPIMDPSDLGGSMGASSGSGSSNVAKMPKIIVEEYNYSPKTIQTGDPFTLNLRIYNTNGKKSVENIRVSLSAEAAAKTSSSPGENPMEAAMDTSGASSAFIPIGSSNSFYIEKIKPKKTYSKDLMLTTAPDTAAKTYSLAVNFEYEDNNGNTYQSSEIIGIPIVQKSKLTLGDVNVEKTGFLGEQLPLSLEFFNTGKSNVENVMVQVRGNFETDLNTYYAGTMAPGATDSYSVNLTPEKTGKQTGEIVISYDDSGGNSQELVKSFVVEVEDGGPVDDMDLESSGKPAWAIPAAIAALAAIGGGIGFVVYKKRKNNDDNDKDLKI